jgi:hypothetical protein
MQRRLSIPSIPGDHFAPVNISEKTANPHKTYVLGILGTSAVYNELHINQLTETIAQLWGLPTKILFQQAGQVAMHIESWADDNNIQLAAIQAEWSKYGPKACMYVNNKIEKEATHVVIIRSPRAKSDRMLQKAEQLSSKKGKQCLVLMGTETDGSILVDHYEVPLKPLSKSKTNGMQDIRNMFLATTSTKI